MKKQDWILIIGGIALFVLILMFEYSGVARETGIPESIFLVVVTFFFALYRPTWAFFVLVILLPLETFSLLPESLGLRLRPYQLLTGCLYAALMVRFIARRLPVGWFRLVWADWLLLVFGVSSIVSAITSVHQASGLKQAIIVWSFLLLYFLTRYFIRSEHDVRRIIPFILASFLVVFGFALWQSVRDILKQASFTAMTGRPNSSFTEADWLGLFVVVSISVFLAVIGKKSFKRSVQSITRGRLLFNQVGWWLALTGAILLLMLTVARSAWLASGVILVLFVAWILTRCGYRREDWISGAIKISGVLLASIISIMIATSLTPFSLGQRATSTSGWQEITISCITPQLKLPPPQIQDVDELERYRCRHINLQEISAEQSAGNFVMTVKRPDPNVMTRSNTYAQVREVLRSHPIFGIGWSAIGDILGRDASGNALNASNIFLEVWLGSGIAGVLAFSLVWFGIGLMALWQVWLDILDKKSLAVPPPLLRPFPLQIAASKLSVLLIFTLLSWSGITVFNLFNSGILLGFVWVWLAIAVSIVTEKKESVIR